MWYKVDYGTLMDALKIADRYNDRIRPGKDPSGTMMFLKKEGLDPMEVMLPSHQALPPKVALINFGLYKGIYRYDLEQKISYKWVTGLDENDENLIFQQYSGMFDVAISYSSEDFESYVSPIIKLLNEYGMKVYAIDVKANPENPHIWKMRFREGLFHSRYFVPIITPNYLDREGSQLECVDIIRIMAEHRSSEFFYPMLPWFPTEDPIEEIEKKWGNTDLDEKEYSVIKHSFPFPRTWSTEEISQFICSLVKSANQIEKYQYTNNSEFLEKVLDQVTNAVLIQDDSGDLNGAKISFKHSAWNNRQCAFYINTNGLIRFVGIEDLKVNPEFNKNQLDGLIVIINGNQLVEKAILDELEEMFLNDDWESAMRIADAATDEIVNNKELENDILISYCHMLEKVYKNNNLYNRAAYLTQFVFSPLKKSVRNGNKNGSLIYLNIRRLAEYVQKMGEDHPESQGFNNFLIDEITELEQGNFPYEYSGIKECIDDAVFFGNMGRFGLALKIIGIGLKPDNATSDEAKHYLDELKEKIISFQNSNF